MQIRIVKANVKWLLCIAYKREIGDKNKKPEPFLFFTPDLPKKAEREVVMLKIADLLVERMKPRTWLLVAAKVLDFKEYAETIGTFADFADVFGTKESWQENLEMFHRQRRSMRNRLNGATSGVEINLKQFLASLSAEAKSDAA